MAGKWSAEVDTMLIAAVKQHGANNWKKLLHRFRVERMTNVMKDSSSI
jgi:hypothetical protein